MLQLVSAAKPGPMERRTIDMGRYVGIKSGGKLVSMAGESARISGIRRGSERVYGSGALGERFRGNGNNCDHRRNSGARGYSFPARPPGQSPSCVTL